MRQVDYDNYGNSILDLECGRVEFCVFPDCGCDGERLCMAENGSSERAIKQNVENMYKQDAMVPNMFKKQTMKAKRAILALRITAKEPNND